VQVRVADLVFIEQLPAFIDFLILTDFSFPHSRPSADYIAIIGLIASVGVWDLFEWASLSDKNQFCPEFG
jgi:hypothetical protein